MLDNLVRFTEKKDPNPGVRGNQLCTLPITVQGLPTDASLIDHWHEPDCSQMAGCQCKKPKMLTRDDIDSVLLHLSDKEKVAKHQFEKLLTWGYNQLWKNMPAFQVSLMRRLITIETLVKENSSMLSVLVENGDLREEVQPVLERPAATLEEFNEFEEHLKEKDYSRKVVKYLSVLGGKEGEGMRRIMRKVANNYVWSHYSMCGQKGKKKLAGTCVFEVIKRAFRKTGSTDKQAEIYIVDTLKYAPNRQGGVKVLAAQIQNTQPEPESE